MPRLCVVLFVKRPGSLSAFLDTPLPLNAVPRRPYWSPHCSFLSCQVKSRCLMEALCHVIGRSIRHSAPGTLRVLIRSLGLLTSQGWMLQQNTDQMTAPRFAQTCKGGGSGKKKSICFASAPPEASIFTPVWCFCVVLAHLPSAVTCIALHLWCKMPEGSVTPPGLIQFQRVNWWRGVIASSDSCHAFLQPSSPRSADLAAQSHELHCLCLCFGITFPFNLLSSAALKYPGKTSCKS